MSYKYWRRAVPSRQRCLAQCSSRLLPTSWTSSPPHWISHPPTAIVNRLVSAVADGPHDAGLCTLKSDPLLHETQLPQTECAMLRVTMNGQMHRPSKLSDKCVAAWSVNHPGVINRPYALSVGELYWQHLATTDLPWRKFCHSWCDK